MTSFISRKLFFIVKLVNVAVVAGLIVWFSTWAADTAAADAAVQKQIQQAQQAQARGPYAQDGVFSGTAQGYGGMVTTQVTVENGYITAVEVTDASSEDEPYLSQALEILDDMLVQQTPNVDVVTGATFSSAGIINGAVAALTEGGN